MISISTSARKSGNESRRVFSSPSTLNDPLRIGIVVATKGRPRAVNELLRFLESQSLAPALILISATSPEDTEPAHRSSLPIEYMYGKAGSSCQRNRALDKLGDNFDLVVFFDDDFAPSPTWLANCAEFFATRRDVVGISGSLIRDGVKADEISWDEAQRLLRLKPPAALVDADVCDSADLYGCNMAFRWSAVRQLRFDERLVLYGWMEDKDYSRMAGRNGRLMIGDHLVGVHRGIRSGRVSGRRYGYSQVVNPWYLHRKGTMTAREAWSNIVKALVVNGSKAIWPEKHIDRLGRFRGNLIGASLLLRGTCSPEKAAEL